MFLLPALSSLPRFVGVFIESPNVSGWKGPQSPPRSNPVPWAGAPADSPGEGKRHCQTLPALRPGCEQAATLSLVLLRSDAGTGQS